MALDQGNKVIPGIPLGALAGIADPKVRAVLTALVDTHNVRNNLAGAGDEAFITHLEAQQLGSSGPGTDTATTQRLLARYLHGNGGGPFTTGSLVGLGSTTLVLERPMNFFATAVWGAAGISASNTRVELHTADGAVLLSLSESVRAGYARSHVASSSFSLDAGSHALVFHAGNDYGGAYTMGQWAVLIVPTS
jgi:hypothetical protein